MLLRAFHWLWPDHDPPTRKGVPASGEGCRCGLVCGVVFGDSGPVVDETEAGDRCGRWNLGFGRRPPQNTGPHLCRCRRIGRVQEANPGPGPDEPQWKEVRRVRCLSKRYPASWPAGGRCLARSERLRAAVPLILNRIGV